MKLNTKEILTDLQGKNIQVLDIERKLIDLTVGEVLINELNNSNSSPKLLWGLLPKLASEDTVELNEEQLAIVKKVIETSMEKSPETRYYRLMVYGRAIDILDKKS